MYIPKVMSNRCAKLITKQIIVTQGTYGAAAWAKVRHSKKIELRNNVLYISYWTIEIYLKKKMERRMFLLFCKAAKFMKHEFRKCQFGVVGNQPDCQALLNAWDVNKNYGKEQPGRSRKDEIHVIHI